MTSPRPSRPVFDASLRSRSYLEELAQYRPPHPDSHPGIDSIVESKSITTTTSPPPTSPTSSNSPPNRSGHTPPPKQYTPYTGVPSVTKSPPRIVESAVTHALSHTNCNPEEGIKSDRLVATLFYRGKTAAGAGATGSPISASNTHTTTGGNNGSPTQSLVLPPTLAPTSDPASFPLEPPTDDPEPLDHLYGSHISPLCLTSFLALINSLPLPPGTATLTSSHRCLTPPPHPRIVELSFSPAPDPAYISLSDLRHHELLYRFEQEWNIDVVIQRDSVARRYPRLVVFDMDSTLIQQEVIDLIAASIGPEFEARVSAITARAMAGEIEFEESFRERVKLLKGVPESIFITLRDVITPTPGARELIRALKRLGAKTAVLSGGFQPLTSWLAKELGIDYAHANTLVVDEHGKFTGEVAGTIVGKERKAELFEEIRIREGVDREQSLAVGDGANDLGMMAKAGLGVAWRAKPRVQMAAGGRVNGERLDDLLYFFGVSEEEVGVLVRA